MSDHGFVRVRTSNGYESSLSADYVAGLEKGAVEILDEPATNAAGKPLSATRRDGRPAKPRTTVKKAAAKKKAAARKTAAADASTDTTNTGGAAADTPEEGKE